VSLSLHRVPRSRVGPSCKAQVCREGSSEVALNQNVKKLIQKLGEAIHESVSESENIAGVVQNIREQGFDVLLMLEATIGLNEVDMESADAPNTEEEEIDGPFTSTDVNFLKSLRISVSEHSDDSGRSEDNNDNEGGISS